MLHVEYFAGFSASCMVSWVNVGLVAERIHVSRVSCYSCLATGIIVLLGVALVVLDRVSVLEWNASVAENGIKIFLLKSQPHHQPITPPRIRPPTTYGKTLQYDADLERKMADIAFHNKATLWPEWKA